MDHEPASRKREIETTEIDVVETGDPPIISIEVTENLGSDCQLHLSAEVTEIDYWKSIIYWAIIKDIIRGHTNLSSVDI